MAKSSDGGDSFTSSGTTGIPATVNTGHGLAVADSSTVFAASRTKVHRTTNSGTTWSSASITGSPTITDIEVSPNYASDSTVMIATRSPSGAPQVFMSTDGGATFTQTGTHKDASTTNADHVVVFDSNYATNSTVYSGTDTNVYRWTVGTSTAWLDLDAAVGTVSGLASVDGRLVVSFEGTADVMRALTPTGDYDGATKAQFYNLGWVNNNSTANAAKGTGVMNRGGGSSTFSLTAAGLLAVPTSATSFTWFAVDDTGSDHVRSYKDVVLVAPTVTSPADAASSTSAPTLRWAPYTARSTSTEVDFVVRLSTDSTFADVINTSYTEIAQGIHQATTGGSSPDISSPTFTSGNTYYWQVSAITDDDAMHSPWSPMQSYTASAGTPGLLYPVSAPGLRQEVPSLNPGLSWTAVGSAADYRVQMATDPTVVSAGGSYATPVLTREVGSATPALQLAAGDLVAGTIYYWQVQAIFAADAVGSYTNLGPPPFSGGTSSNSGVFVTPGAADIVTPPAEVAPGAPVDVMAEVITADPALKIVGYGNATAAFQFFDASLAADHPANDLLTLEAGDGVWIFNNTAADITATIFGRSLTIPPGWSLKGL